MLYGTSAANLSKLQRIQNSLAKLVIQQPGITSSMALHDLHWLPIQQRIDFKISTLTYKLLHSGTPYYLSSLLQRYIPTRPLRSANHDLLVEPATSTVIGSRAFSIAATSTWNKLPIGLRHATSLLTFRRLLKAHLFSSIIS